jgi:hypothetical protein
MWPFKKTATMVDVDEEALSTAIKVFKKESDHWADLELAELKAFRDVGETFNYLGRECVVTGHRYLPGRFGCWPHMQFDYCDNNGVIHSMSARANELPALIKQQNE